MVGRLIAFCSLYWQTLSGVEWNSKISLASDHYDMLFCVSVAEYIVLFSIANMKFSFCSGTCGANGGFCNVEDVCPIAIFQYSFYSRLNSVQNTSFVDFVRSCSLRQRRPGVLSASCGRLHQPR